MTLILALLAKVGPALIGVGGVVAGGIWVWLTKKKTDAKVATVQGQAATDVANARVDAQTAKVEASATNEAAAKANEAAAQQTVNDVQEFKNVDQNVAALPDGAALQRMRDAGLIRNDDGTAATGVPASTGTGSSGQDGSAK